MLKILCGVLWDWPMVTLFVSFWIYYLRIIFQFEVHGIGYLLHNANEIIFPKNEYFGILSQKFIQNLILAIGGGNLALFITVVYLGGAGSVFWFIIFGIGTMIFRMIQTTLIYYYSDPDCNDNEYVGISHCVENGISKAMHFKHGKVLTIIIFTSVLIYGLLSFQNYYTSNLIAQATYTSPIKISWLFTVALYLMIILKINPSKPRCIKILGGVLISYFVVGMHFVISNIEYVIPFFNIILTDAFQIKAFVGGVTGRGLAMCIKSGMQATIYTGGLPFDAYSANYINSSTKKNHPVKLGILSAVEVLIETLTISLAAFFFIIVTDISGVNVNSGNIVENLLSRDFAAGSGVMLSIFVFIFGVYGSLIWYRYLQKTLKYGLKKTTTLRKIALSAIKLLYPICGILMIYLSELFSIGSENIFSILMILLFLPTVAQLIIIISLSGTFKTLLNDYINIYLLRIENRKIIPLNYKEEQNL